MPDITDPFAHHPELRDRIKDAETSYFRTFSIATMLAQHPHLEVFLPWTHSDEAREAIRAEALAGHDGDLWVFAYGSLMWDPALRFAEVRRAYAPEHERRFILFDDKGGRGSPEAPGLMAALDLGDGCEGLAYRIRAADVDRETEILFRREVIAPGYIPTFIPLRMGEQDALALTFLADHDDPDIRGDITRDEQIRYIATGAGVLGTSRDYLANIVDHFAHLGITDAHCEDLWRAVEDYPAARPNKETAR
ncbi:gamma-glutamylcyclotransferase [Jannaschia seohaensis]|uniref:glutathione-specific gamma-glutamylcyclotransferase n=1 Tax=Jannaschia seohaensis TaxID=475081 RepID=A0A2Y9A253_9RHOB|nr:gamma-glutamylcyclotransferase [Jannaschia seohaensis]PWJ21658.1 cation transport protein ChaC [Jannaschia seohaensis]SSA37936.1 cation transport protein ChaC [Jannaschia seohaensis]